MTTTPVAAPKTPTVTVTLAAFSFLITIDGRPETVTVPAGVKGTFPMPALSLTIDSTATTVDSATEIG